MKKLILALALVSMPAVAQDRVSKFDADKDGKVSYEEITLSCEVSKQLFERADKDNDSFLSNSEMRTAKGYLFSRCNRE